MCGNVWSCELSESGGLEGRSQIGGRESEGKDKEKNKKNKNK